ncbi:MAG: DUF1835 domain-containing protein [Ferruginibacter sp.]|nr:DUF1835 domain-containing protein [Ferruginibacter sp.]
MIHIVFQEADIEALEKSFELDETLKADIIQIKDDYAVGPLQNIFTQQGIEDRKQWWREVLAGSDLDGSVDNGHVNDEQTVLEIKEKLDNNPEEFIWIWAAQNKHDVSGYYWLMSQLKDYQGRIFILYLNNLPFLSEKGNLFYPANLFEIPAKEFVKAKKLAREITPSEFEVDPDEWIKICEQNKGVRLLEGGKKLVQEDYDFYDTELKKLVTGDWQKASKIIHTHITKAKQTTGDMYLLWRLKTMIAMDMFDVQGTVGKMKEFEVKNRAKVLTTNEES